MRKKYGLTAIAMVATITTLCSGTASAAELSRNQASGQKMEQQISMGSRPSQSNQQVQQNRQSQKGQQVQKSSQNSKNEEKLEDKNLNSSNSQKQTKNQSKSNNRDSSEDTATVLSDGTVTATIGGKSITLSGAYVIDGTSETISGGTYSSSSADQNVFLVINGGSLTLTDATITKTGDASTSDSTRTSDVSDTYNFYGMNSVILVVGSESSATLENCTITSDASGANAIFSTAGSTIRVSNTSITTTGNSSRGVYATYDGNITATGMTITTSGAHCAPIATDRGGGTVVVSNSTVSSSGDGSPSIYSTGDITVTNVTGTTTQAQAAVIEGKNSVTMIDSNFTVGSKANNGIMIYQSGSGDAADSDATSSISTFNISGTTIDLSTSGPLFYVTNTTAKVTLGSGNSYTIPSGIFANAAAGKWGSSGSNGGTLTIESVDDITGELSYDSISSITVL